MEAPISPKELEKPLVTGLVIKVASRCNLNCTYCYMYNMGDDSYKAQPKFMSNQVVDAMYARIREHCLAHGLDRFVLQLHGGEPLLAGIPFFERLVARGHEILEPEITPVFLMQTNGLLLDPEWCDALSRLQIGMGISIDGTQEENDRYRVDHAGRGSYEGIVAGIKVAQNHMHYNPGLLAVINLEADPVATYEHFLGLGAEAVDYLIPDVTYEQPPAQPTGWLKDSPTPLADWLIKLFDHWYASKGRRLQIRVFDLLVASMFGHSASTDSLGGGVNKMLVVETDGSIEAVDVLKICGQGFTKAHMNVVHHSFDEALGTELAHLFYHSHKHLPRQCLNCPVKDVCGGGYLPHRYKKENGFNNPSYYCQDLMKLITHVQNKVLDGLPADLVTQAGLEKLTFEEAKAILASNLTKDQTTIAHEESLLAF